MGVYVASKFEEKDLVRSVQNAILDAGFSITHDWTYEDMLNVQGDERQRYLRRCGAADVRGVRAARVLVVIPHPNMKGGYVEVGVALALDIPIVAYFPHLDDREVRMQTWRQHIFSNIIEVAHDLGEVLEFVRVAHEVKSEGVPYAECKPRLSTTRP